MLRKYDVTDFWAERPRLFRERYGMIEVRDGKLYRVRLRPLPKLVSLAEVLFVGRAYHSRVGGDRCLLYYNQPRRFSNFIALKYIVSARDTTLASLHGALVVLDEIARMKRTDALLCDVSNFRISDRLLRRWGWEPHLPSRWRRHHIKRFYGSYPDNAGSTVLPPEPVAEPAAPLPLLEPAAGELVLS
ncbi:MAG: hypothetical protein KDA63_01485 [Planctomycetales bacterium]|nr:hypothetical protein [Planctomycetales bacterium]